MMLFLRRKNAAAPAFDFSDTFTGANGTSLDAHTPDADVSSNGWTESAGSSTDIEIQSNQAVPGSTGATGPLHVATFDTGHSDGTLSATIVVPDANPTVGLVFRYADDDNLWAVLLRRDPDDRMSLFKRQSGSWNNIDLADGVTGASNAVSVVFSGNGISVLLGETEVLSTTDSFNVTETSHGVRFPNDLSGYAIDDLTFVGA